MRQYRNIRCDGGWNDAVTATTTYHTDFTDEESVSLAVVRGVAAIIGVDPGVLPPLGECIETDALEALFTSPGVSSVYQSVTFRYADCLVTVRGDGNISLTVADRSCQRT